MRPLRCLPLTLSLMALLSGTLLHPARCQEPPAAVAEDASVPEPLQIAAHAFARLQLTRLCSKLQLTGRQAGELLPAVERTRSRMQSVAAEEELAVARLLGPAEAAHRRALAGGELDARLAQQYTAVVGAAQERRRRAREEQVQLILARLRTLLTPQQLAQLEREAALTEEAPSPPGGGDAPGARLTPRGGEAPRALRGALDRVRRMGEAEWQAYRRDTLDEIEGSGSGARRGDEDRSPEQLRRLALRLQLLEEVRTLSDAEYEQQRTELTQRLARQQRQGQRQRSTTPEERLRELVARRFLHATAPAVLRCRMEARP